MTAVRLFGSEHLGPLAASHATLPTPLLLDDGLMRVYVSARDHAGRSLPYAVDVALDGLRVVGDAIGPLLTLGERGCFDEDGIMPASAVRLDDGSIRLYYIGWNRGSDSVPYRLAIGTARSTDGTTFERESTGPVLDRSRDDPIFVTTPWVSRRATHDAVGGWSMIYVSASSWDLVDGRPEPRYHLAAAHSPDGLAWTPEGRVAVDLVAGAYARPSLLVDGGDDVLACCHRGMRGYRRPGPTAYRLAFLERTPDGEFRTIDDDVTIPGDAEWASEMRCYPHFVPTPEGLLMLYNGDGFGRSGVLAAWIERDGSEPAVAS